MGLGLEVSKALLDMKAAQAVLELRSALNKHEAIAVWLANHPVVTVENVSTDPLIAEFGYDDDEAYALRFYFQQVDSIRTNNPSLIEIGRKMTGLE